MTGIGAFGDTHEMVMLMIYIYICIYDDFRYPQTHPLTCVIIGIPFDRSLIH